MNLSQVAASRSRNVESRAFFPERVSHITDDETNPRLFASPYAWVFTLRRRVLSGKTKLGSSAKLVLAILLEHVNANGRTWVGIETLAEDASFGSTQTVRNALEELVENGWLEITSQTWASLTAEQLAEGQTPPRRGDGGQAPNRYVVLDGSGNPGCGRARPGLARATSSTSSPQISANTPPQILEGSPSRKQEGEPLSKLIGDQDPSEDGSMKGSGESASRAESNTHISSKTRKKNEVNLEGWNVIVEAHTEKTKATYGLPPLPPELKRDQREALATAIDGAAAEVRARVHDRTGVQRELSDVRVELAKRVMCLYFKRDNEHLRKTKHALRDLPREFHARLTEAMQAILRESHNDEPSRRPLMVDQPERIVSADKPPPNPHKKQLEAPNQPIESVDKPRKDLSMSTALEARRLLEALNTSPQQDLFRPSRTSTEQPKRANVEPKQEKFEDKASPESFEDKSSPRIERPLGRTGAPRWGSIGPRPTKMRRVNKLTPDDAEPDEEHGMDSTAQE